MPTQATARSARHLGSFTIFALVLITFVAMIASLFAGILVLVPLILFLGPVGVIAWYAFHERTLPDGISPREDERHGP